MQSNCLLIIDRGNTATVWKWCFYCVCYFFFFCAEKSPGFYNILASLRKHPPRLPNECISACSHWEKCFFSKDLLEFTQYLLRWIQTCRQNQITLNSLFALHHKNPPPIFLSSVTNTGLLKLFFQR